jgi:hypothetical protein
MHKIKWTFVFLYSVGLIQGQNMIASIPIGNQTLRKFQSFCAGDTLFVTYEDSKLGRRFFYVHSKGGSENFSINEVPKVIFCGFENIEGKGYHYFIETTKKGEIALRSFTFDTSSSSPSIIEHEIPIEGKLIGVINGSPIQVLTHNEKKKSIRVYKVSHFQLQSNVEYSLPENSHM